MIYNFDEIVDRSQNNAVKLEEAKHIFGSNDVIPLWVADMDFKTAPCIVEAIKQRADQAIFGYTSRPREYFQAVADWQQRRNGWAADTACMAFAYGVVPGIHMALTLATQPGDRVLIQPPVYHPFAAAIEDTGRQVVESPLVRDEEGYYTIDFDHFEDQLKTGVKAFILCNPHNPVGRCWTARELKTMGDLCVRYGAEIISDEIHSDLMLDGHRHTCMASLSPEIAALTTTCIAPSKTFNLAGLQAATVVFPNKERRTLCQAEQLKTHSGRNNCFSIVSTIAAYTGGEEWLDQLLVYLSGNMQFIRDFCRERIPELQPNTPEATYLNWIDARALGLEDKALLRFLVDKAGVAMNRGDGFGKEGSGFLRLNAACPRAVIEKALTQIETALRNR